MFKIGVFSKMNKVTVKTLRYYDEIGLLSPSHVDEATGYRYYSDSQCTRLQRILALRQIGFSLQEIISMSQNISTGELIQYLYAKQVDISQKIELERKKLKQVRAYLAILEKEESIKNFWSLNRMIRIEISDIAKKAKRRRDDLMLKIEFTEDAMDYIIQKNADSITVHMMNLAGCTGNYWEPAVSVGKPCSVERYDLVNSNGNKVYIFKGAESEPDGIKIFVKSEPDEFPGLNVSGLVYAQTDLG